MPPDEKVGPPGQPTLEGTDTYATPATTTCVPVESRCETGDGAAVHITEGGEAHAAR